MINRAALENRQAGRDREEIRLADLQEAVAQAASNSSTSRCLRFYLLFQGHHVLIRTVVSFLLYGC